MIPDWLQKLTTEGITIPVKLVITPEIDQSFLEFIKRLTNVSPIKSDEISYHEDILTWVQETKNKSVNVKSEDFSCRGCGSKNVEKRGFNKTKNGVFRKFKCRDCGHWTTLSVESNSIKNEHVENITCPDCDSTNIEKRGFQRNKSGVRQKYKCRNCGDLFTEPVEINEDKSEPVESVKLPETISQDFTEETITGDSKKIDNFTEGNVSDHFNLNTEQIEEISIEEYHERRRAAKNKKMNKTPSDLKEKIKNKRFWPVPGDNKVFYIELEKDALVLCYNAEMLETSWPEIIHLSSLPDTQLNTEIVTRSVTNPKKRIALKAFVQAYREERVRDPDAGIRPVLNVNTRADYDGNKIEGTMEG